MKEIKCLSYGIKSILLKASKYAMLPLLFSPLLLNAQRKMIYTNGVWLCHFGTIHLDKRLSIVTEAEVHLKQWVERWNEQVYDVGLSDKLSDKWRVAAGIGWYRGAQYLDKFFFRNEWRPWQEANFYLRGKWVWWQRMRVEERWVQQVVNGKATNDYEYTTRLRYRSELQKPLLGGKISPVIGNEFMVNPNYWNSNHFMDQNRSWIGINVKLSRAMSLQTQYMKIFQWRTNNTLEDQNIFRVNVVQHFNLKS